MTTRHETPPQDGAAAEPGASAEAPGTLPEPVKPPTRRERRRQWFRKVRGRFRFVRRRHKKPPQPNPSSGLRILIVSDAWHPQLNGVVRTLDTLGVELKKFGNEVRFLTPDMFRTVPLPTYSEIRLALAPNRRVAKIINEFEPDAIHIATEGPIGMAARRFCVRRDHPFTTSFHTRFPEYVNVRTGIPTSWGYRVVRWFHSPASALMVTTPSLMSELDEKGFKNLRLWTRGVDLDLFNPGGEDAKAFLDYPRPIWIYVGRVAVEKNIEAFLDLDLPGTKLVVGEGPQLEELKRKYQEAEFVGAKYGEELSKYYAASDVMVFPSLTDTFGLVNVEALACGIPIAAYPVLGPRDIIGDAKVGAVHEDLGTACQTALGIATREECRAHAEKFSWSASTRQFLLNLDIPGYDHAYWEESAEIAD